MAPEKIKRLKQKYEEARVGLDKLQEEVLTRGIEMRPGLRRQFDEALRGLFYTMACADGRIDVNEVRFYNYLFEEQLSITTFELVKEQLERSSNMFEEDYLSTVAAFASYDKSITGQIPLDAPSLSMLLISASEAVARLVMESDGDIDQGEIDKMRQLLVDAKNRASMVLADAEDLLAGGDAGNIGYDPDADMARDIRAAHRLLITGLVEAALHGADVVRGSRIGMAREEVSSTAAAARVVADSIRDDLERGRATGDLLVLAATQLRPIIACLKAVEQGGDDVSSSWRQMAAEARESAGKTVRWLRDVAEQRTRMLKEKHDWHDDVSAFEARVNEAWAQL